MRHSLVAFAGITLLTAVPAVSHAAPDIAVQQVTVTCKYRHGTLTSLQVGVKLGAPGFAFYGSLLRYYFRKAGVLAPPAPLVDGAVTNPAVFSLPASFAVGLGARTVQVWNAPTPTPPAVGSNIFDFTPAVAQCPVQMVVLSTSASHVVVEGIGQLQRDAATWSWKMIAPRARKEPVPAR